MFVLLLLLIWGVYIGGANMKYIVHHRALVVVAAYGHVGDRGVAGSRKHVVAMSAVFF